MLSEKKYLINSKYRSSLVVLLFIIIICGCKKNKEITYVVSGQLLVSVSNPLPVKNYKLFAYQKQDYALLGSVAGLSIYFETDNNGIFSLKYIPPKGTGLFSGTPNANPLSIEGVDTGQYKNIYFHVYPIPANKDTNLNKLYLF